MSESVSGQGKNTSVQTYKTVPSLWLNLTQCSLVLGRQPITATSTLRHA